MVKKSGRRLIVAGKSLPLAMVGTMLAAQAVDGNSSLGNIALVFEFGFWAGEQLQWDVFGLELELTNHTKSIHRFLFNYRKL